MTLGIIGVGHMAGFIVQGLRGQGYDGTIVLGPRNRDTAAQLAADFGCQVAASNQAAVDAAEAIFLTVPAKLAKPVLEELKFRPDQLVISACAGQGYDHLKPAAAPARLAISMPLAAAAIGKSPTLLYPDDEGAKKVLTPLGPVQVMKDEATFSAAVANSATCGWFMDLIRELAVCNERVGLAPDEARRLVTLTVEATTAYLLTIPEQPLPKIVDSLASKGGITERGLEVLRAQDANAPWRAAFEAVLERLGVAKAQ